MVSLCQTLFFPLPWKISSLREDQILLIYFTINACSIFLRTGVQSTALQGQLGFIMILSCVSV